MRKSLGLLAVFGIVAVMSVADADVKTQAQTAADAVKGQYGSPSKLEGGAFKPMSGEAQFQTGDGQNFDAALECPAANRFMTAMIAPSSAGDIQLVGIELDRDLNGSLETPLTFPGPFAAVCSNGVLQCTPGTSTNCVGKRWKAVGTSVTLETVPQAELGGCYCVNNSCGASLLLQNSRKVLTDIGTGIANQLATTVPRLSVGSAREVDATTMEFFGQQSGCGVDSQPEQYSSNVSGLQAAGQAEAANPSSTYSMLVNSPAAQEGTYEGASCNRNRVIQLTSTTTDINDVVSVSGATLIGSCGADCYRYRLGRVGDNYWSAGCGNGFGDTAAFQVHRPDLVEAARVTSVRVDDYVQIVVGGITAYQFPAGWTPAVSDCRDRGNHSASMNANVTTAFTTVAANGTVTWANLVRVVDRGEAYSHLDLVVRDSCLIQSETINDGCASLDARTDCSVRNETADGVQTIQGYNTTGLQPLASTRVLSGPGCTLTVTRDWWDRQRDYTCEATATRDLSYAGERERSIRNSFDATSGTFTDRRMNADGTWSNSAEVSTLPPPDPAGCIKTCKTRKARPGSAMTSAGATSMQNPTGVANDFTYRECDAANVCPLEAGETMVSACDCASNFMEAVMMMQTIRMTAQDFVCEAP